MGIAVEPNRERSVRVAFKACLECCAKKKKEIIKTADPELLGSSKRLLAVSSTVCTMIVLNSDRLVHLVGLEEV